MVREINAGGDELQISARLKQRFDDRDAKIEFDVSAFIAELRQKGLIQD
jgi:hypothetical protein